MNIAPHVPDIKTLHEAFGRVYDPEFGVSVEDLGLIYDLRIEGGSVFVTMTLTSMYCPAGDVILAGVRSAAEAVPGVTDAEVCLVFEPIWTPERLSIDARKLLGWDEPRIDK